MTVKKDRKSNHRRFLKRKWFKQAFSYYQGFNEQIR